MVLNIFFKDSTCTQINPACTPVVHFVRESKIPRVAIDAHYRVKLSQGEIEEEEERKLLSEGARAAGDFQKIKLIGI